MLYLFGRDLDQRYKISQKLTLTELSKDKKSLQNNFTFFILSIILLLFFLTFFLCLYLFCFTLSCSYYDTLINLSGKSRKKTYLLMLVSQGQQEGGAHEQGLHGVGYEIAVLIFRSSSSQAYDEHRAWLTKSNIAYLAGGCRA